MFLTAGDRSTMDLTGAAMAAGCAPLRSGLQGRLDGGSGRARAARAGWEGRWRQRCWALRGAAMPQCRTSAQGSTTTRSMA